MAPATLRTLRSPLAPVVLLVVAGVLVGCEDNVGRAFDPHIGGGGGGGSEPGDATGIEPVSALADVRDGRPVVRDVLVGGTTTTPIVLTFNESLNPDFVLPTSAQANDALITVRQEGTQTALPAEYDLLEGNRLLIIRPTPALPDPGAGTGIGGGAGTFEVVVDPEVRDLDGIRFGGSEPAVVASFTLDRDPDDPDGRVVAVVPVDNADEVQRESNVYLVFDKPADATSVTTGSFQVRTDQGVPVAGDLEFPLDVAGQQVPDTRVVRFDPDDLLAATTGFEVEVTGSITFAGGGVLEFFGRAPFSRFDTLAPAAPTAITVGNPTAGFPDKINRSNFDTLRIDVTVDASAGMDDVLLVRVYGLEPDTRATGDFDFVERSARLPMAGAQTISVDFVDTMGTLTAPRFEDGDVVLAAQLRRGRRHTGFEVADVDNDPSLDLNPPSLDVVGPPNVSGTNDILTDQESLTFYGTASEEIGGAELTDGSTTVDLFAASGDGRFVLDSLPLGRRQSPLSWTLVLTDAAGNMAASAAAGRVLQRGLVTGTQSGTLTVEAYDDATLRALGNATVVLDPGVPSHPASGQLVATTGNDGRATFTGLGSASYTVTILAPGYDLVTMYDTSAAFVSLPLRPEDGATSTLEGRVVFTTTPGATALVGSNLLDDRGALAIATTSSAPDTIPSTPVLAGRPQVLTAFAGVFEPTSTPTFSFVACQMCGVDGLTPTPPAAPVEGGDTTTQNLALLPASGISASLASSYTLDLSAAAGLDTANLIGDPIGRVTTSAEGFGGQFLTGVGAVTDAGGGMWTVDASYALTSILAFSSYSPLTWVVFQAEDTAGNLSRHRTLLDPSMGTVVNQTGVPGIPTISTPGSAFDDAPRVDYQDRLDRSAITFGQAMLELTATDPAGRRWVLLREDTDGAVGAASVFYPDLGGVAATGLATGTWSVRARAYLYLSVNGTPGDQVLAERRRAEVTHARSAAVDHTVN